MVNELQDFLEKYDATINKKLGKDISGMDVQIKNGIVIVPKEIKVVTSQFVKSVYAMANKEGIELNGVAFEEGSEVEKIDEMAFYQVNWLRSIDFSNCAMLSGVQREAFYSCNNLTNVNFSSCKALERIARGAFANCENLKELNFADCVNLREIESSAFKECLYLSSVNFSSCQNLTSIGNYAFRKCVDLKEIDLNGCKNLTELHEACFELCWNLESVKVDALKKLKTIGAYCFAHSGLKEFEAPSGKDCEKLTVMQFAFAGCGNLEKVKFENCNLDKLYWSLFSSCSNLREASFKGSELEIIGDQFKGCANLENLDFRGVRGVEHFGLQVVNAKNVKFSNNVNWSSFKRFNRAFENGTKVSLYNGKGEVSEQFVVGEGSKYEKARIGALYLKKKSEDKNVNIPFDILNALFSEKEMSVFFDKNDRRHYNEMCDVVYGKGGGSISFVSYLRALGYFGFEDYKTGVVDKSKVDEYKKLLARDLVYNKIKKDIKGETNKDYINKIINEKVLKVARSYKLTDLVYAFVMNNVANNEHKKDLTEAIKFVKWRREKNVDFAQFMVLNFDEIMDKTIANVDWKHFEDNRDFDDSIETGATSFMELFENFGDVLKNSNKKVITRSDKNRLTLADFEAGSLYEGVTEENKELATYCLKAHIKQEGFDFLKDLYEKGKAVKDKQVLKVCEDEVAKGKDLKNKDNADLISYKVIEKGDPLGLVLGNITNCCQRYGGVGEECMSIGATDVNSGFVTINEGDVILAQGWIWYDPKTCTVAIDNIEVPEIMEKIVNKEKREEVANCVQRFCDNAVKTMNENGHKVHNVVIGVSCTDIESLEDNYIMENDKDKLIECPFYKTSKNVKINVYSDVAKEGQYVVYKDGKRVFIEPESVEEQSNLCEKI